MSSFGGTVKLTGESEYQKALKEITGNLKLLGSEMKFTTSLYDQNDKSVENLSAQNEILNKKIDEQEKKVSILKDALAKAKEETGENSATTNKWQIKLNEAQAELNKLNHDLDTNKKTMADAVQETKKEADAVEDFGEEADKSGKSALSLGDIIKANLISDAVMSGLKSLANGMKNVGSAMISFGKDVVESYGELEQNLGGSEAVFGEYAKNIQKIGEDAYKSLGVSQSDYLATANKMGALFQGSGIEQQKSLELTSQAMQRAADMASVMGIDMQVALDSVAGAAKGNFTMMDNLGVAMNATTIEAYAASKGFDFVWKSASQAQKTEMAMKMFFENTEQYAGNFAKESTETVSGSLGLLQASFDTFMAGLGDSNADMANLTQNVADAFDSVVSNLVPVVENILSALPTVIESALGLVTSLLPSLLTTVTDLLGKLLATATEFLPQLAPVVVSAFGVLLQTIFENLPLILSAGIQVIVALADGLSSMLPELIPLAIDALLTLVDTLASNLDLIIDAGISLILGLADGLLRALPQLIEKAPIIIDKLMKAYTDNAPKLIEMGIELTLQLAGGIIKAIPQLLSKIPQLITSYVDAFKNYYGKIAEIGGNIVSGIWNGISNGYTWIKDKISGWVGNVLDFFKELLGIHSPSTVFEEQIGENLALGVGEGFTATMSDVTNDMANAIPTEFDTDISTSMDFTSANSQMSTYDMMVSAFKQALTEVKVVMDDREMGGFVANTIERVVYA